MVFDVHKVGWFKFSHCIVADYVRHGNLKQVEAVGTQHSWWPLFAIMQKNDTKRG